MHQVQKGLQLGCYKEFEIVMNPFRMIAWHPRSNETCFWVLSSRHRCLLRNLRRMSIHFLWEDADTFLKSRDIKNQRVTFKKIGMDSTLVACKLRLLREEMSENRKVSKIWNAIIKSYLFTVQCLSDDYKFIAIVRSCNEASVCLHCLLQLPLPWSAALQLSSLDHLLSLSTPHASTLPRY